jgi:cysteine-rich repeat protein
MNSRKSPWPALIVAAFALLAPATMAQAGTCAGLSGGALSVCRQYCNKLQCQAGSTSTRCLNLRARFIKNTGACQLPCDCGNGVTSGCEQCDDGNATDGDACTNQCTANVCGDGSVRVGVEDCDDGNNSNDDACKNDCSVNSCGDGVTWTGVEQCDDGNGSESDACKSDCTENTCGDGAVETGVEDCDDGNDSSSDACKTDCSNNVCGDNFVRTGAEACDDGNDLDTDACKNNCTDNVCGDGATYWGVEECDDANPLEDDECKNDCTLNVCNDGFLWTGVEDCEDFNQANDDECKNDCTFNVCGDGVVRTGVETCDRGAPPTQDDCTENCEIPVLEAPILEDFSSCSTSTADRYRFPVLMGETIEISADTVDAETAADLCFYLDCTDGTEYARNDDVDCTFAAPDGSTCPSVSFNALADGTCELNMAVCAQGCFDTQIGNYLLNVTRSGQNASVEFYSDDD